MGLEVCGVEERPELFDGADFSEFKVVRFEVGVLSGAGFVVADGVGVMQVKFGAIQNFAQP